MKSPKRNAQYKKRIKWQNPHHCSVLEQQGKHKTHPKPPQKQTNTSPKQTPKNKNKATITKQKTRPKNSL
jgi:hypothetical protein